MTELNGHQLYGFFRAGARRLRAEEEELNRINVFPVPDGDTGTNMAFTMSHAVEAASPAESASAVLEDLAEAALAGARGNSGVILAQFIAGLREAAADAASLSLGHFAKAVDQACESARRAISDPQEGTILSVIRDWADALAAEYERSRSFTELFRAAAPALRASLAATRERLEVLRRADVVDAGASGFVAFIEGAHEYFEAGAPALPPHETEAPPPSRSVAIADSHEGPPTRRYCTEFLLAARVGASSPLLDLEALKAELAPHGNSLIVAGGPKKARIHLHTDRPDLAMEAVSSRAAVLEQKVDDMRRQYQDAHERLGRVALVTDSACDLPAELLDLHRIHVLPLYLRLGSEEYLDRLTLEPSRFYELAEASPVFPKSSQPVSSQFERLFRTLLSYYDQVVAIHVSGRLSGTCEASRRAAALVDPERIRVVDSRQVSGSLGLLVLRAAELLETGASAPELLESLSAWTAKAEILVSVKTLASMVRGGRVSPLKGALARLLDLKPIVSLDAEGSSRLYGAAISTRRNLDKICAMVLKRQRRAPLRSYAVVHAQDEAGARALAARLEALIGLPAIFVADISVVVGLSAGRGALAVSMMSE